jgi:hypothetical protein
MNLKPQKYRTPDKCNVSKCNRKKDLFEYEGLHLCPKHLEEVGTANDVDVVIAGGTDGQSDQAQLQQEASQAKDAFEMIESMEVVDGESLEFAAEVLSEAKGHWKRLEEMKKKATKPMNDALKEVRSWFKPAQDFYSDCEQSLKAKIALYKDTQDAKKLEAKAMADAGDTSGALATLQDAEVDEVTGLSYRKIWDFEIEDEELIPAEFWRIDKSAIKIRLRETNGEEIPGIRPFQKTVPVSR